MTKQEEAAALKLIKAHGYYQLINGYGKQFEETDSNGEKHYRAGTNFNDIFSQYMLDHELGRIVFQAILEIEEHFKNIIAYTVSKHFGINNYLASDEQNSFPDIRSYLDFSFYPPRMPHQILMDLHQLSLTETKAPTGWYRVHKNHIPPWILFMNATLGTINQYYKILPPDLKSEIVAEMLPPAFSSTAFRSPQKRKKFFWCGLELMRDFRNCIAHGSRMYSFRSKLVSLPSTMPRISKTEQLFSKQEYSSGIGVNDLFSCMIWIVVTSQDFVAADSFIRSVEDFRKRSLGNFPKVAEYFWSESKLPNNFVDRLRQLSINIFQ